MNEDLKDSNDAWLPTSELLIMADGRILTHNLTPELAGLLSKLNPDDPQMKIRALPFQIQP